MPYWFNLSFFFIFFLNFQKIVTLDCTHLESRGVWLINTRKRIEILFDLNFSKCKISTFNFQLFQTSRNLHTHDEMKRARKSRFSSVPKCIRRDGEKYIFSRRGSFIYRHANLRAVSYSRLSVFTGVPDTKKRNKAEIRPQRPHTAMTSSISRRERRGLFRFSRVEGEGTRGKTY